ncbi:MAG: DUF2007 domain-containing protein [Pirellulales bacterium]
MKDSDELFPIYEAGSVIEAHFVKNLLLDEGIEASVTEEDAPLPPITPTHVLIFRRDEARARAIIDKYDDEQERRATRPDWKCPRCNADVVGAFDQCDVCGADRPGTEDEDYSE